jgi:hypothetical protein
LPRWEQFPASVAPECDQALRVGGTQIVGSALAPLDRMTRPLCFSYGAYAGERTDEICQRLGWHASPPQQCYSRRSPQIPKRLRLRPAMAHIRTGIPSEGGLQADPRLRLLMSLSILHAPKGQRQISPGQRPGKKFRQKRKQALQGRHRGGCVDLVSPFQGSGPLRPS